VNVAGFVKQNVAIHLLCLNSWSSNSST